MSKHNKSDKYPVPGKGLPKSQTGITGLDEITGGGIPKGRPTLICGDAGCGKTLMSVEFIVRGAMQYDEPGVFMAFEERTDELIMNVASLGFDLDKLIADKKIRIDHVHIERNEIEETGEYDLEGLFIRLDHAIKSIGAKRVVLDTIENLFSGLNDQAVLRSELRRLFHWLKDKGVTAIITGERGENTLTRQGLEEYVSDCVILLDHRVINQISTRRLRIIKYRGTTHGTNEYPFLIDEEGISVLPVTSLKLEKDVSTKRISSGIKALDVMLGDKGFFRGGSVLVSGTAGTGKTSIASCFASSACSNNERAIYFAFEESPKQIIRNMKSINIDLEKYVKAGLLKFCSARPTLHGLEMHLVSIHKEIRKFKPTVVILDPITNFVNVGSVGEIKNMLIRLIDFLQNEQITVMFTALASNTGRDETDEGVSSLVDTWMLIKDIEFNGERNKGIYVMKSRGMKHSNQVREFVISDEGLDLVEVFLGPDGILTGSAREEYMLQAQTDLALRDQTESRKEREITRKRRVLELQIAALNAEFESVKDELNKVYDDEDQREEIINKSRETMTRMRRGDQSAKTNGPKNSKRK